MRVLLVSTYELGRQPVHVSSPAAALTRAGHDVEALDLAVQDLEPGASERFDAVAISVPMHTATRLALIAAARIRSERPDLPIALYGLYAGVPEGDGLSSVDAVLSGEYEPDLLAWLDRLEGGGAAWGQSTRTGRSEFAVPDRTGLPPLERYARLEHRGETRLAAAVEASHGCRHRCRHCPIPVVYDGRMRVVPKELVLADIDQVVAAGASHITFGDPDFLNAPRHSLDLLEAAHSNHPDVTFDATIKVSHIVDHADLWPDLAAMNMLFVVSAFETVHEPTLEVLDKGHTVADMSQALDLVRSTGIFIRPTWLPFVPWTEPGHIVDLFGFIEAHDLAPATDPVQMSIKLLIPRGSLLESHPVVTSHLASYDPAALFWVWSFSDPVTAAIHEELGRIAAAASDCGAQAAATLDRMRLAVNGMTGAELGPVGFVEGEVPRLTESWFCCAEPTEYQLLTLGSGRVRAG